MKVIVSAEAENDLNALRYWIAEDNPPRAATFLDESEDKIADLAHRPERFPIAFYCSDGPVHRRNHRGYRILYLIEEDVVEVAHVHHGSRDLPQLG